MSNLPYEILEKNKQEGFVVVKLNKSILGSLSNQLKDTKEHRKHFKAIKRLGHDISRACNEIFPQKEIVNNV